MRRAIAQGMLGVLVTLEAVQAEPAELAIPEGEEPVAGVVLMRSCVGNDGARDWAAWLVDNDFAVLISDHRGSCRATDQESETDAGAIDRARRELAAHPRVDGTRVAVLGLAEGGRRALRAADRGGFRAVVAVHPRLRDDRLPDEVPILMLSGRSDPHRSVSRTRAAAAAARRDGQRVELHLLPAAGFGFDAGRHLSDIRIQGLQRSHEPHATSRARRRVRRFLAQHLAPSAPPAVASPSDELMRVSNPIDPP